MRPVGGWQTLKASAFAAPPRGMLGWQDNSGDRWLSAGTYNKLYVSTGDGTVSDITPVGLTAGTQSATVNTGYGGAFYGKGTYGTARTDNANYTEACTWSMGAWGQYLVACSVADGKLYEWQLNTAAAAAAISGAPTGCLGLVVTPERFLFALGAGGDPRKVQWCDQGINTTWTAAATNQAGDQIIEGDGQIMCGVVVRGQTLILTDTDAHTATYQGQPFIYGFERIGTTCGVISRKAAASANGTAYWMGRGGFYTYSGGAVEEVPCEVADYVFGDLNTSQASKIHAIPNGSKSEVWWFFPSSTATEPDKYVAYNYREGHWLIGSLDRCSGVDRGAFRNPIWADDSGNLYTHEVGTIHGTSTPYAESGPVSIADGENIMHVVGLIPDEQTQGEVTATFKTRFYPNATESSHGPYTMANPTSVRFAGRQVRMRVTDNTAGDWRVGLMRLDARAGGKR